MAMLRVLSAAAVQQLLPMTAAIEVNREGMVKTVIHQYLMWHRDR